MSPAPKFSIVTPSFNQAAYIGETIESVLSQEGDFSIEYFVMDGGSTDGSVEVIRHYSDQLACGQWRRRCNEISMRWVSQKDRGQSDAINQGLRRATGDIASYINSDDAYFQGAFERVARAFVEHPEADFIYGDGDVIDAEGRTSWEWLSRPYNHAVMTSFHFLWNDFSNYIMQQATFWRSRVSAAIGLFDESLHFAMDADYWIRGGHHGLVLRHLPTKLGKFRMIEGTKSLSSPNAFWPDYLEIFRRYGKATRFWLWFACYFFNIAKHSEFDLDRTWAATEAPFERWQTLTKPERRFLLRARSKGFTAACFIAACALERAGRLEQAEAAFARGVSRTRLGRGHPLAMWYLTRRIAPQTLTLKLDSVANSLVTAYRDWRYNYRYRLGSNDGD